ncbi:hypothetical protein F4808DRAFT_22243 [Astrocystis sublimbata]|nr:hypothetical protein F4808DRAFT_22243 [Astrocystis sublimbata]
MAPMDDPIRGDRVKAMFRRLEELYEDGLRGTDDDGDGAMRTTNTGGMRNMLLGPKGSNPSIVIPSIINYLRDNDSDQDVNWGTNFKLIRGYLADAHRRMVTGDLGFGDYNLRAALEDARVMVRVHLNSQERAHEKTKWTDSILRGQSTQERLLTYPGVFPLPEPDRSKSQYRPMNPTPRPHDSSALWNTTLKIKNATQGTSVLSEVNNYVGDENEFFRLTRKLNKIGDNIGEHTWGENRFAIENRAYEEYMSHGVAATCASPPRSPDDGPRNIGTTDTNFYRRRGWQRAALQQCLNLFTSHENRDINTPWRRPVLPYDPPVPLPREIAYAPRVPDPQEVKDELQKDPFSWLHWSSQYTGMVDYLAYAQRRTYDTKAWNDSSASALPANYRGPHLYSGLSVHDQHWLQIGSNLEKLEHMIYSAWSAAPRPLLRAILRDIDAGKHDNTGGLGMDNSLELPIQDDDDAIDRKRYWRRDIKRILGIDNEGANTDDKNYNLVDDVDAAWLRYLCEPSRTLEMCNPSKQPPNNLAIIFDAKLQSYLNELEVSGYPDSKTLDIWTENQFDLQSFRNSYKMSTLRAAVAYINGCEDSELMSSGERDSNPEHPNGCYQFSLDEAEFLCMELQNLRRCLYSPEYGSEPARVGRPSYNVHPEDRVRWRYPGPEQFHELNEKYLNKMVDHYDNAYGKWSMYLGNRLRYSRELEFMLDHTGSELHSELQRVETEEKQPDSEASLQKRREFIKDYLAPEGLPRVHNIASDNVENERAAPHREDLASWEAAGAYMAQYQENHKDKHDRMRHYYPRDMHHTQTPERTVQFFRNLAYRAGRTMRYADQIKNGLQYLEKATAAVSLKKPLDLSVELKEPRPENVTSANAAPTTAVVVEKWRQPVTVKDYNNAIEQWHTTIQKGDGEVALALPHIRQILTKADPALFKPGTNLNEDFDAFKTIREGIIENCFQNRPTMYPGRLSGFKDQADKEYQGLERPNLFEWATKDQRRYQAPHTRQHFFNMQRWPLSRMLPHRHEAVRARKDEISRKDPSKSGQAYGILTTRVPVGKEKPVYARPLNIHHGPAPNNWHNTGGISDFDSRRFNPFRPRRPTMDNPEKKKQSRGDKENNLPAIADDPDFYDTEPVDTNMGRSDTKDFQSNARNTRTAQNMKIPTGRQGSRMRRGRNGRARMSGFVPYGRSDEKFAPGPAVFPMGDTLLQKVLISNELGNALYPQRPFYRNRFLGLSRIWGRITRPHVPLVPLVPPTARSNIPRSNPRKRKMPIEFLNGSSTTKKFRSDQSAPLQQGGNGGQFGAATGANMADTSGGKDDADTDIDDSLRPPIYENTRPTWKKTTATEREESTSGFHELRVYPDPSRSSAVRQFASQFRGGVNWTFAVEDCQFLATNAILVLLKSINSQVANTKVHAASNYDFVQFLQTEACEALVPYILTKDNESFDMFCVAYLLEAWGNKHGEKLQLGILQEDVNSSRRAQIKVNDVQSTLRAPLTASLVGSRHNKDPNKTVVWIHLWLNPKFDRRLVNPFNKVEYNAYEPIVFLDS